VESDIPEEFLHPDALIVGRISTQQGNWRYACENGFDMGHSMFLHRYGALLSVFRRMAAWRHTKVVLDKNGWLSRNNLSREFQSKYPGLGVWPRQPFWKLPGRGNRVSIRLPGFIRNTYEGHSFANYVWWTPIDKDNYRMLQIYAGTARNLKRLFLRVSYFLIWKPLHHIQFNNQDAWMVRLMPETPPERLYRPDASITAWRKLCERSRGRSIDGMPTQTPGSVTRPYMEEDAGYDESKGI
jgi:hypothetical protein